jgi:peptide/nickel transport system substrate-binding protein
MQGYWERATKARLSRRRLIASGAAAGTGLVAMGLAGCGSGGSSSSGSSQPADKSGLLGQAVDTSKSAVPGGTLQSVTTADVTSFDPLSSQSFTTDVAAGWTYSRLLKVVPGHLEPSRGDLEGDLAEKFEVSDDKLQVTFHLRKNAKWDARSPTSSRPVDADDVIFSWKRYSALSPYRSNLSHDADVNGAVVSVTAPDKNTVVFKLAQPDASVMTTLSSSTDLLILPREADGGFDPKAEMRGSSAWILEKYQPSQGFTWAKNPNWYRKDRPFLDKYDTPIVPEYSQGLAQFRAGNVLVFGIQNQDILSTKKDIPAMLMLPGDFNKLWFTNWFGYNGDSPFKDERVRQAMAMSYDRDIWIDTIYDADTYESEGLPVQKRYHSHISSGVDGWWVDPQDTKAFGENSKYFTFAPDESKKLLSAAGYPDGVDTNAYHIATAQYGRTFTNQVQIQIGFINDVGIRTRVNNPDYQTSWLPDYYYGKGDFEGVALGAENYAGQDVGLFIFSRFHPKGGRFKGFDPTGTDPLAGDPTITKMAEDIRQEFDIEKRRDIAKKFQQYMAKAMYLVPFPGQAAGFTLTWPAVGNARVFRSGSAYSAGTETIIHTWLDKSKPPFKS